MVVVVEMVCFLLHPLPAEAGIDWFKTRRKDKGDQKTKAVCIGGSGFATNLNAVRGIINDMDTTCVTKLVDTKNAYKGELTPSTRKILYSLTHGGLDLETYKDEQHLFKGLLLVSTVWEIFWYDWLDVNLPEHRKVKPTDLPNLSFDLVFINACHAGDVADGYSSSESANFRAKFGSNAVYVAPIGSKVEGSPSCCTVVAVATSFAVDFFNSIKDVWNEEDAEATFFNISSEIQNRDRYIIYNAGTLVKTVFPFPQ